MGLTHVLCFALLLVGGFSDPVPESVAQEEEWIQFPDGNGQPHWVNLKETPVQTFLNGERDVTFFLYTRRNPTNPVQLYLGRDNTLTNLNVNEPTNFIIHGWNSNRNSLSHVRTAYINHDNANVIVVDWSGPAGAGYASAKNSVKDVGQYIASFLDYLATRGVRLANVHLIGHSLGAHVSGCAGSRVTAGRIGKITGLDPAAPSFGTESLHNRLDASDATFVQVIHTNGGLLGWADDMGDADFYPNNGRTQPGCGIDLVGSCAHSRAHQFFAESVSTTVGFWGQRCSSWNDWTAGRCNANARALMGARTDRNARGAFYFRTASSSPFAQG